MTENEMVELAMATNEVMNQTSCGYILARKAAETCDMSVQRAVEYVRRYYNANQNPDYETP